MDDTQKCPHVYITDKWGYVLDKEKKLLSISLLVDSNISTIS